MQRNLGRGIERGREGKEREGKGKGGEYGPCPWVRPHTDREGGNRYESTGGGCGRNSPRGRGWEPHRAEA